MNGLPRQISERAESLESREHVGGAVGMQGGAPALVAGVEGLQQLAHFSATDLAHDQPVRPHPQGLAHEVDHGDESLAFDIRRARLETHDMAPRERHLEHVLDHEDALARINLREHRRQQGRLPGTRPPGHDERHLVPHEGTELLGLLR